MTTQHIVSHYMDGHVKVEFCKVCSAEGPKLLEDCQGSPDWIVPNKKLLIDAIPEKYNIKPLDDKEQSDK